MLYFLTKANQFNHYCVYSLDDEILNRNFTAKLLNKFFRNITDSSIIACFSSASGDFNIQTFDGFDIDYLHSSPFHEFFAKHHQEANNALTIALNELNMLPPEFLNNLLNYFKTHKTPLNPSITLHLAGKPNP